MCKTGKLQYAVPLPCVSCQADEILVDGRCSSCISGNIHSDGNKKWSDGSHIMRTLTTSGSPASVTSAIWQSHDFSTQWVVWVFEMQDKMPDESEMTLRRVAGHRAAAYIEPYQHFAGVFGSPFQVVQQKPSPLGAHIDT